MRTLKRAEPNDFLDIAALDRIAWKDNPSAEFIPDGEHVWRVWVEHALVYVAKENDTLVGAVVAFPCLSGDFFLHKVFVDLNYRGQGIAPQLFELLFSELDESEGACSLTVDPVNESAIQLYTNWGFSQREFVKGYYRDNEDRYVLTRPSRRA
ncbi:N-acetyltransferase [Leucothrix sargassi]|nr:N-acetyltransferase [Leucothrix sargassi]